MNHPTNRRSFLALAGVGVAGAAAAVVVAPSAQAATPAAAPAAPVLNTKEVQNLVVHVKDARAGVLTVMVAGRDVEVTDRDLVNRLVHAANNALQG